MIKLTKTSILPNFQVTKGLFWYNERKYFAHIPGHSIGSDKQAVEWINSCLGKILELPTLRSTLVQLWLDAASKYTQSLEVEV